MHIYTDTKIRTIIRIEYVQLLIQYVHIRTWKTADSKTGPGPKPGSCARVGSARPSTGGWARAARPTARARRGRRLSGITCKLRGPS